MNSGAKLTLAFLDSAPKAAAQVLQDMPPEQASAFLETVAARLAAPVFSEMIPWQAARRLELIRGPSAAMVLRQLPFFDATTMARLVASEFREQVLQQLPTKYARRLSGALKYPRHQVGAWIDPEIPTLNADDTVGDALRVLRAAGPASHIFLESPDHRAFRGTIEVNEVLRAESSIRLGALKIVRTLPVSNRASLSSVSFDERWDDSIHLPVVGRRGNLLGGLSRASLRTGVHEQFTAAARSGERSLLEHVCGALLTTCAGILNVIVRSMAPRPSQPQEGTVNER